MLKLKNTVDPALCARIKQIRLDRSLTQTDFADEHNTTRVAINAIEHGRYNPGIDLIRSIRNRYKMSYDFLIDGK